MNWYILIPTGLVLISLVIFLILRNQKDEKEFEDVLKGDYPKPLVEKKDEEIEDRLK